jgi:CRP-like cAMP-binding protein
MVKAQVKLQDGRFLVMLGLSDENIRRMKKGDPIGFDAATLRMGPGDVLGKLVLFYGEDEATLHQLVKGLIGPDTEVLVIPRSDPTKPVS